jgi:hypothetical protein
MMGREVGRDEEPGVAGPREEGGRPNRELGEDMVGEDVGNDIQCSRIAKTRPSTRLHELECGNLNGCNIWLVKTAEGLHYCNLAW